MSAGIFKQKGTTTTRSVVKNEIVYEIFRNISLFKMPIEFKMNELSATVGLFFKIR